MAFDFKEVTITHKGCGGSVKLEVEETFLFTKDLNQITIHGECTRCKGFVDCGWVQE